MPAGVQPVGRFVEHKHRRITDERRRQTEVPHAQRVAADRPTSCVRQADQRQRRVGATVGVTVHGAVDPQMIPPAAAGVKAAGLERSTDHVSRTVEGRIRRAADRRRTPARIDEPKQHPQRRDLARAVGPEERGDVTQPSREGERIDRADIPERLGEPPRPRCSARWPPTKVGRRRRLRICFGRNAVIRLPIGRFPHGATLHAGQVRADLCKAPRLECPCLQGMALHRARPATARPSTARPRSPARPLLRFAGRRDLSTDAGCDRCHDQLTRRRAAPPQPAALEVWRKASSRLHAGMRSDPARRQVRQGQAASRTTVGPES